MEKVTVFTANIGRKETAQHRKDNLRRLKHATMDMENLLIGFQEIDEADSGDEHGMLDSLWPSRQWSGFGDATPVLITRALNRRTARVSKTCEGRAHVTPHRVCVQSVCEIGDYKFVHMNGHYPFNAPDLRRDCNREWTRLAHEWFERGFTVITTRDTNWHGNMPKLHPKERLLTKAGAIDRITVIENKIKVRVSKRHRVNLTIDGHDAVGLTLNLKG